MMLDYMGGTHTDGIAVSLIVICFDFDTSAWMLQFCI